nr:hypothetical protein Iba_chr08fCG4460 [Ipomoea batatas]
MHMQHPHFWAMLWKLKQFNSYFQIMQHQVLWPFPRRRAQLAISLEQPGL